MATQWYVLNCKAHKEGVLSNQLQDLGFEVFFPRLDLQLNGSEKRKISPFFPGFLFVKADLEKVGESKFQWILFTSALICNGGKPAYLPDDMIASMMMRIEQMNLAANAAFPPDSREPAGIDEAPGEEIFRPGLRGSQRVKLLMKFLHH